jgi:hypothetical protein
MSASSSNDETATILPTALGVLVRVAKNFCSCSARNVKEGFEAGTQGNYDMICIYYASGSHSLLGGDSRHENQSS